MPADLRAIIEDIASRADDFLSSARDRAQGRAGIAELLTMDYPELRPSDRNAVIAGVMHILENEDFFGVRFADGAFEDDPEAQEES